MNKSKATKTTIKIVVESEDDEPPSGESGSTPTTSAGPSSMYAKRFAKS